MEEEEESNIEKREKYDDSKGVGDITDVHLDKEEEMVVTRMVRMMIWETKWFDNDPSDQKKEYDDDAGDMNEGNKKDNNTDDEDCMRNSKENESALIHVWHYQF